MFGTHETLFQRDLLAGRANGLIATISIDAIINTCLRHVKRRYRIWKNERIQEVRRQGRSFSDSLLVLCVLSNDLSHNRFGFSVSSRVGKAFERNRIKRRLSEAIRLRLDDVESGWDCVLIARKPARNATYSELDAACARLIRRAHLFKTED